MKILYFSKPSFLFFLLSIFLTFNTLQAKNFNAAITGVIVTDDHSKSQCVKFAHQICDKLFDECVKSNDTALGLKDNYLIIYQCHYVKMTRGSTNALVIAGSSTKAYGNTLIKLMNKSYNLANDLFNIK